MEQTSNKEILERLINIERNMATKQELKQAMETIAILSNEETMKQIRNSEKDIANDNFKEITSVEDI